MARAGCASDTKVQDMQYMQYMQYMDQASSAHISQAIAEKAIGWR